MGKVRDGRLTARGLAALGAAALTFAACAPATAPGVPATRTAEPGLALQVVIVASQVLVGEQRVPVGILDRNTPVNDASVRIRVYRETPSDPLRSESDAPFKGEGLEGKGVYVAYLKFAAPGQWTAEITAQRPSGARATVRLPVMVTTQSVAPAVGEPAPRSRNLTIRDVPDVGYIDSGRPPNDMHDLSIADAIAQQRPSLVVFATPAFCVSQMCAPQVNAVRSLQPAYRDRLAFIHVEIFVDFRPDPSKMRVNPVVLEWRLPSEPWVFLIDRSGIIGAAFEGPTAAGELRAAIERMLAAP